VPSEAAGGHQGLAARFLFESLDAASGHFFFLEPINLAFALSQHAGKTHPLDIEDLAAGTVDILALIQPRQDLNGRLKLGRTQTWHREMLTVRRREIGHLAEPGLKALNFFGQPRGLAADGIQRDLALERDDSESTGAGHGRIDCNLASVSTSVERSCIPWLIKPTSCG